MFGILDIAKTWENIKSINLSNCPYLAERKCENLYFKDFQRYLLFINLKY